MLTVSELISATNGKLLNGNNKNIIEKYSINSNEIDQKTWFIPIVGQKTDAHKYIAECVKGGIIGTYINADLENKENIVKEAININKDICIIEVKDTLQALKDSGTYNRKKHMNIPVVAVTGSVGKTSTREMIASILSTKYNVLKTIKNYNSNIGFSLMLLMIENQDICVFEMGMDGKGQLKELSNMAKPSIAVITNIGTSHIGLLGSKENIFKAKMEITSGLEKNSILIVNNDDEFLTKVKSNEKYKVIKYGLINSNEVSNITINENNTIFTLNNDGKQYLIKINEPGKHQIYNTLAGINVAKYFKIDMDNIINGIDKFKNFDKRMEKIIIKNNVTLIDDSYNASYDSMMSGLNVFEKMNYNRKIIVLGDMFELGKYSKKLHESVGKQINNMKFDIIVICGNDAKYIYDKIDKENKKVIYFEDKVTTSNYLINEIISDDAVYFKASNGMKFIDIIDNIKNNIK